MSVESNDCLETHDCEETHYCVETHDCEETNACVGTHDCVEDYDCIEDYDCENAGGNSVNSKPRYFYYCMVKTAFLNSQKLMRLSLSVTP
jgi:hypothetical protein